MNEPELGDANGRVAGDLKLGVPLWVADLGGGRPVDDPAVDLGDRVVVEEEVGLLVRFGDPDVDALDADAGSPELADGFSFQAAAGPAGGLVAQEPAFERRAAFPPSFADGDEGVEVERAVPFGGLEHVVSGVGVDPRGHVEAGAGDARDGHAVEVGLLDGSHVADAMDDDPLLAVLAPTGRNGDVDDTTPVAPQAVKDGGGVMAEVRAGPARQNGRAQPPAPGDAPVADGVDAPEHDREPADPQFVLDPLLADFQGEQLIVFNNPVLLGGQVHNIANWSSFRFAMNPNLDQFGGLGRCGGVFRGASGFHIRLSARTG